MKDAQIEFLQQRIGELESEAERAQTLQAELNVALAAKKAAENRMEQLKTDFDQRSSVQLSQIRGLQAAAAEREHKREEFERAIIDRDKELATVKANLRDLQNS